MTESFIDDEQEGFRAGSECVDHIFTVKEIVEKGQENKCRVYMGFMDLEKAYDKVNREALWLVLRMYDVGGKLLNSMKGMNVKSILCLSKRRSE